ncbi:MAG: hypothetical protein MUF51_09060 [Vicinamibacteria bacterium]|jgi:hypothetical protein|nr:hypothetical protein [Vicinamibacteria bacterium]
MPLRLQGLIVFLPVPLVLWLFNAQWFGLLPSLLLGIVLMATHRQYARPFALRHAERRCLWCGRAIPAGITLRVAEPMGASLWTTCGPDHTKYLRATLAAMARHALLLRIGVLGTLAVFLIGSLLCVWPFAAQRSAFDLGIFFRLGIAVTVAPLGWLAARTRAADDGELRVPFPLHIQALIGTYWVLWLFRIVGLAWLILSLWQLWRRLV